MIRRILLTIGLLLAMSAGIASAHPLSREIRVWETLKMGSPYATTDWLKLDTDSETRYPIVFELKPGRAAGSDGLKVNAVQTTTALTGGLHAGYFIAQPGSVGGTGSAKLMALEIKTRQPDSAVPYHSTLYISTDIKDQASTEIRAIEISMDGDAGGTATTAYGVKANNNTSGVFTTSYGFAVQGPAAWTYDFLGQNSEKIDNATDTQWQFTSAILKHSIDTLAYWTATQADGAAVTFASVSDGTPGFTFTQVVNVGTGYAGTGATITAAGAGSFDALITGGLGVTIEGAVAALNAGIAVDSTAFTVEDVTGAIGSTSTLTSQTTENNQAVLALNTDSTFIAGTNITYSGGYGSSSLDISGTYSGVNGAYVGAIALITSSGAHTADGAGTIGMKAVVTNTAAMADGNIYGGMFWAKHSHASNDMLASASLIGLEGMAYPANVGRAQTLIGVNAGYHIEATTENHTAGSVARGLQVVCDDASSNTDPTEETGICIWNMTGDQDNAIKIVKSASGFTYDLFMQNEEYITNSTDGTVTIGGSSLILEVDGRIEGGAFAAGTEYSANELVEIHGSNASATYTGAMVRFRVDPADAQTTGRALALNAQAYGNADGDTDNVYGLYGVLGEAGVKEVCGLIANGEMIGGVFKVEDLENNLTAAATSKIFSLQVKSQFHSGSSISSTAEHAFIGFKNEGSAGFAPEAFFYHDDGSSTGAATEAFLITTDQISGTSTVWLSNKALTGDSSLDVENDAAILVEINGVDYWIPLFN